MINQQIVKGQWNELAGQVKKTWGRISDQELKEVHGDAQKLVGLIQRKTGESREQIERQIEQWFSEDDVSEGNDHQNFVDAAQEMAAAATMQASETCERLTERALEGYDYADTTLRKHPWESIAVAFGAGMIAGALVGVVLRGK